MAAGGMYDLVGGGFHRYSVDAHWLVPHFEKMLYDNALLVPAYLHAWLVTGEERYRDVAEETLEYMLRELRLDERRLRLGAGCGHRRRRRADVHVDGGGGRAGRAPAAVRARPLIIRGELDDETRARLLAIRERGRSRALDDKVIASWNGLVLAALAEGARRLERDDLLEAAGELGELLGRVDPLWRTLARRRGEGPGYLDDYANVAHGFYELHVATGELRWLHEARRLALLAVELFADDERGGFFLTPADGEELVARQKDLDDNPTPSGNSMLAFVLFRLARIWGDDELERRAVGVLRLVRDVLPRAPSAFGWALCALDLHLSPPREIAIVGARTGRSRGLLCVGFDPNAVVAFGPADDVPLLAGKTLVDGKPAVYVCERFACRAPVTDASEL